MESNKNEISREKIEKAVSRILAKEKPIEKVSEIKRMLYPISIDDLKFEDWERIFQKFPTLMDDPRGFWLYPFNIAKLIRDGLKFKGYPLIYWDSWVIVFKRRPDLFPHCGNSMFVWVGAIAAGLRELEDWKKLQEFDADIWLFILENRPELANANYQYPSFWAAALALHPERESECTLINRFKKYDWITLFARLPQFADKYKKLKNFDTDSWVSLLLKNPSFAKKCRKWKRFSFFDWKTLLQKRNEELEERATKYVNGWLVILEANPDLISQCDKLADFSQADWEYLYSVSKLPAEYLQKYIRNPETISDNTWSGIIRNNPKMKETAKKYKNGWIALLESNPKRYENEFPYWGKLGDGLENAICITNRIYNRIKWDKIKMDTWVRILKYQSDDSKLIAHCPWDKFEREHWKSIPPKFADKCKFPDIREKLNKAEDKRSYQDIVGNV